MKANNLVVVKDHNPVIMRNKVVRLRFRITEQGSDSLLQYGDDLFYLHGGYGGAFPKVERALEGCMLGDTARVLLAPEDGYGHHDPSQVMVLPPGQFDEEVPAIGEAVEGQLPNGESMVFTVAAVLPEQIILDGNHPFAGKQLAFDFEVLEIRDSTSAERSAGFAFDGMFS